MTFPKPPDTSIVVGAFGSAVVHRKCDVPHQVLHNATEDDDLLTLGHDVTAEQRISYGSWRQMHSESSESTGQQNGRKSDGCCCSRELI